MSEFCRCGVEALLPSANAGRSWTPSMLYWKTDSQAAAAAATAAQLGPPLCSRSGQQQTPRPRRRRCWRYVVPTTLAATAAHAQLLPAGYLSKDQRQIFLLRGEHDRDGSSLAAHKAEMLTARRGRCRKRRQSRRSSSSPKPSQRPKQPSARPGSRPRPPLPIITHRRPSLPAAGSRRQMPCSCSAGGSPSRACRRSWWQDRHQHRRVGS